MALPVMTVDLGPGVLAGFTTRHGGVSTGPWASLDLALHVGDDPRLVARNRKRLASWVGAPVSFGQQVHGTRVRVLAGAAGMPTAGGEAEPAPECDATVATDHGAAVGVLVADCVPVLLADPEAGVVAAAHAGRRGLLDGLLEVTVDALVAHGAQASRLRAALGPSAGACCYEVGEQMRADAAARRPSVWGQTSWGTPSLDLRAGCRAALASCGVHHVIEVGGCTIESPDHFSYRRAPVTGRFAGFVRMTA